MSISNGVADRASQRTEIQPDPGTDYGSGNAQSHESVDLNTPQHQRAVRAQVNALHALWQNANAGAGLEAAGVQASPAPQRDPIGQLQALWHGPGDLRAQNFAPAGAGPTPPAASDLATAALVSKLQQG